MKYLGSARMKLATIKVDEKDIAARMKKPDVIRLAETMRQLADDGETPQPLQDPVVNGERERVLIIGRDRFAALRIIGVDMAWFKVVKANAQQVADAEEVENIFRRDIVDRDKKIAARVERLAKKIAAEEAAKKEEAKEAAKAEGKKPTEEPRARGRQQTPEGKAREVVAKEQRTTPDAIRKSQERAKIAAMPAAERTARKLEAEDRKRMVEEAKPPVNPVGLVLPVAWCRQVRAIQEGLEAVGKALFSAKGAAGRLAATAAAALAPVLQAISKQLSDIDALVAASMPKAACVACKDPGGEGGRRAKCKLCQGTGYLTASQWDAKGTIPAELLVTGAKAVVSDGHGGFALLSERKPVAPPEPVAPPKAANGQRKLDIRAEG
jgi:hypothetical protein